MLLRALTLGVCLLLSSAAHAQTYKLDLQVDIPLIALGAAVSFAGLLKRSELPACAPNCDTSSLNALDRTAVHYASAGGATLGDIMLPVLLVAPLVLTAIDTHFEGIFAEVVVLAEAVLLTQMMTQLTKFAVQRNSPPLYSGDDNHPLLRDFDATRSFFSAHTATTCSAAAMFTVGYFLRHPNDPMRFVVLAASAALALGTGVAMVLSGAHFWTDVMAGAVAGSAIGALVPIMHVPFD